MKKLDSRARCAARHAGVARDGKEYTVRPRQTGGEPHARGDHTAKRDTQPEEFMIELTRLGASAADLHHFASAPAVAERSQTTDQDDQE